MCFLSSLDLWFHLKHYPIATTPAKTVFKVQISSTWCLKIHSSIYQRNKRDDNKNGSIVIKHSDDPEYWGVLFHPYRMIVQQYILLFSQVLAVSANHCCLVNSIQTRRIMLQQFKQNIYQPFSNQIFIDLKSNVQNSHFMLKLE